MAQISTEGDNGDACFTLAILKHLPNGPHELLIEEKSEFTNIGRAKEGAASLLKFIKTFVEDQPYISECRLMRPGDHPFWRSGGFRGAGLHRRNEPLMQAHLNHLNQVTGAGLKLDASEPWLTVKDVGYNGLVVVNRTSRYTNNRFPWGEIANFYCGRMAFIGLSHEHQIFCNQFGSVPHIATESMKELAEVIAGSNLFIGNQSCANAIAEGLKHPSIQETSLQIPDCVFKRDNVQHVWDGGCTLPSFNGEEPLTIRPKGLDIGLVSVMKTPPEPGWTYPGVQPTDFFYQCHEMVSRLYTMKGKTSKEIEDLIKQYTLDRIPEYYRPPHDGDLPLQALKFAGYA